MHINTYGPKITFNKKLLDFKFFEYKEKILRLSDKMEKVLLNITLQGILVTERKHLQIWQGVVTENQ